jgi:hypothetical protein
MYFRNSENRKKNKMERSKKEFKQVGTVFAYGAHDWGFFLHSFTLNNKK